MVIIQDDFIKNIASRFYGNTSWTLDSTSKTNQYGLISYAIIIPNQDIIGVPVFDMLRSNDIKQGHEGIALELTLIQVFGFLGEIQPLFKLFRLTTILKNHFNP